MQVAFIGFALLIGLGFIGYRGDGTFVYGPWLLGGLIPLFVGIAQIIGAVLSGATFGPPAARQRFGPPPPTPERHRRPEAQLAAAMPPGPTYGGWRPGSTPEIEKPARRPTIGLRLRTSPAKENAAGRLTGGINVSNKDDITCRRPRPWPSRRPCES